MTDALNVMTAAGSWCLKKIKRRQQQQQQITTTTTSTKTTTTIERLAVEEPVRLVSFTRVHSWSDVHKISIGTWHRGLYKVSINDDEQVFEYPKEQMVQMLRLVVQLLNNCAHLKVLHIARFPLNGFNAPPEQMQQLAATNVRKMFDSFELEIYEQSQKASNSSTLLSSEMLRNADVNELHIDYPYTTPPTTSAYPQLSSLLQQLEPGVCKTLYVFNLPGWLLTQRELFGGGLHKNLFGGVKEVWFYGPELRITDHIKFRHTLQLLLLEMPLLQRLSFWGSSGFKNTTQLMDVRTQPAEVCAYVLSLVDICVKHALQQPHHITQQHTFYNYNIPLYSFIEHMDVLLVEQAQNEQQAQMLTVHKIKHYLQQQQQQAADYAHGYTLAAVNLIITDYQHTIKLVQLVYTCTDEQRYIYVHWY